MDIINSGMLHLYYRMSSVHSGIRTPFCSSCTALFAESLLQYAATLAFYLYLRASDRYVQRPKALRSHPVMSRLLTLKQSIATLEDLGVGESDLEDDSDLDSDAEDGELSVLRTLRGISEDELRALWADMADMQAATDAAPDDKEQRKSRRKQPKKTTTAEEAEPPKKKRKTDKKAPLPATATVFDLVEPEFSAKPKPSASRLAENGDADAFGELTALQTADAMDKAARRRSLRFHTSKIESASARRERARTSTGGDDDIPWRDRRREKEEKQKKAAQKSREQAGEDLDDVDPESIPGSSSKKRAREEEADSGSDDGDGNGYYDLVKRKSKEKKEKKKSEYEAAQAAAK